jgi:hypothetical protein
MDEIELLVEETYRHFHHNFNEDSDMWVPAFRGVIEDRSAFPELPGIIYHVQKSTSIFVVRTLVSRNLREDFKKILERPEDYPSLRILESNGKNSQRYLKFFIVKNPSEAEIIHDQLHNRRFPIDEEMVCNISDPGFSWWLTKKDQGFQISFTMSVASDEKTIKLGPLGDRELAIKKFKELEELITSSGINVNIQNEVNRVQFNGSEDFLIEELKDLFEFGVITETLKSLFKILLNKVSNHSLIEDNWYYLHELASIRRFWIQIQYDLNSKET